MKSIWHTLVALFDVLPHGARPFYIWYSVCTAALSLLDTAALGLIVLSVTPLASGKPIELPVIGVIPQSATVWVVATVCALFILKGVLAVALHWFATRRFARYELEVGDRLFHAFTRRSWQERSRLSTAEITRIVDSSMANTNLGFILPLSQVPGNALTFISVTAVLVFAQPLTALIAVIYLSLISLVMLKVVTKHTRLAGQHNRTFAYRVATVMTEMMEALKEVTLRDKLDEVGTEVNRLRLRATKARANISFLANVPKYSFEVALIGGFMLIGGSSYFLWGPSAAVVSISLFAATGFRMIPAMNGIQDSFNAASANEVYAKDVIKQLARVDSEQGTHASIDAAFERRSDTVTIDTPRCLQLRNVSFEYPGSDQRVLKNVSISIPFGSRFAIVGPSGAGKSTLIDIILGLSEPTGGSVMIDDAPLSSVIRQWRSRVGYVPQKVSLFDASVAQNVALTWTDDFDDSQVEKALEEAQLQELLARPEGIHNPIGERGMAISGGQQQRLGIARALYVDPLVLVLDEATSALDTATENRVTDAMRKLRGEVTFVTIAHRLATIRDYDQICYLENGAVRGVGTFEEVVAAVPEFEMQARLAGLVGGGRQ